eukprot:11436907-Alexandrium_andersonii.AAC.1
MNIKPEIAIPKPPSGGRPESGRRLLAGSSGITRFRGARWGSNRFAALSEDGCSCCPLEVEAEMEEE